jgi:hypothetical protein
MQQRNEIKMLLLGTSGFRPAGHWLATSGWTRCARYGV